MNRKKHPKCLGDGIDHCGYDAKIDCSECKYSTPKSGLKDPSAKCNQFKTPKNQ